MKNKSCAAAILNYFENCTNSILNESIRRTENPNYVPSEQERKIKISLTYLENIVLVNSFSKSFIIDSLKSLTSCGFINVKRHKSEQKSNERNSYVLNIKNLNDAVLQWCKRNPAQKTNYYHNDFSSEITEQNTQKQAEFNNITQGNSGKNNEKVAEIVVVKTTTPSSLDYHPLVVQTTTPSSPDYRYNNKENNNYNNCNNKENKENKENLGNFTFSIPEQKNEEIAETTIVLIVEKEKEKKVATKKEIELSLQKTAAERIIERYNEVFSKRSMIVPSNINLVLKPLKQGYSEEDLVKIIENVFSQNNESEYKWGNSIAQIFADSKIDRNFNYSQKETNKNGRKDSVVVEEFVELNGNKITRKQYEIIERLREKRNREE